MTIRQQCDNLLRIVAGLFFCGAGALWAQTTTFSYQGELTDAGNLANGDYDLQFKLYDTATVGSGTQQGDALTRSPTAAIAGVFSVTLDFGVSVFSGADWFLEIGVRPAGSASAYTVLAPRHAVTPAPYAIETLNVQRLDGQPASAYPASAASGNFGINTANPVSGRLHAEGQTANTLSGRSSSGVAAFGTSTGAGVQGTTTAGRGVIGSSTSGTPVHDERAVASGTAGGVYGKATSTADAVVIGEGNNTVSGRSTNGIGVYGTSTLFEGVRGEASNINHGAVVGIHGGGGIGVFGTSTGVGVQGTSAAGTGVIGQSTSGWGVYGASTAGPGIVGGSTTGSGVYGESTAASLTAGGVYGKGTASGSIGVIGEANVNDATGVYGVSSSPSGFGVFARNLFGGRALYAEGNAGQSLGSNGLVKAMIAVDNAGGIVSCYNGVTNSSSGNCGFTVTLPLFGVFRIGLGFAVANRFYSVTVKYDSNGAFDPAFKNAGANYRVFDASSVEVFTFKSSDPDNTFPSGFMMLVF